MILVQQFGVGFALVTSTNRATVISLHQTLKQLVPFVGPRTQLGVLLSKHQLVLVPGFDSDDWGFILKAGEYWRESTSIIREAGE